MDRRAEVEEDQLRDGGLCKEWRLWSACWTCQGALWESVSCHSWPRSSRVQK
ncbi:uncharacterized protein SCHCODRAFT_02623990 [Schizophyllum commune H4-8]|uniref:uncharacterized protein n=1 Tax=Schizophyllum commune (strain H4-8 / FGSC 9210) TaxID=578458 RepID=UPI00215FCB1C|nr:uncharacterized protein SCHCODRAFT_02623990 [Schizophyllum commune H4-8]KAI5894198.1 hypothetical protein SCHCODRAFT_02623990 [Schizophyllum commune H4-8]